MNKEMVLENIEVDEKENTYKVTLICKSRPWPLNRLLNMRSVF